MRDSIEGTTDMSSEIAHAAFAIAGDIFGDAEGTLKQRLLVAINWKNRGTDGDLTPQDREALRWLLDQLNANSTTTIDVTLESGAVVRVDFEPRLSDGPSDHGSIGRIITNHREGDDCGDICDGAVLRLPDGRTVVLGSHEYEDADDNGIVTAYAEAYPYSL